MAHGVAHSSIRRQEGGQHGAVVAGAGSRTRRSRSASRPVGTTIAAVTDIIEVEFSTGRRLTVRGVVDGGLLRTVLQELSQC
jgi:hypothetical protein